ncbi:MAG TPA: hypothetical protein VE173_16180, partial [Longimicrobiales bacterium]|nr:hypothetical protein [Longimicrobiales bacterium]
MNARRGIPFLLALVTACGPGSEESGQASGVAIDEAALQAFQPLPETLASDANPMTPENVALGRML